MYQARKIFSALAIAALVATTFSPAVASAATTHTKTIYSPDRGAKAIVYWQHRTGVGGAGLNRYKVAGGFHLTDLKCDGKGPRLTLHRTGLPDYKKNNDGGCKRPGKTGDIWVPTNVTFNGTITLCNGSAPCITIKLPKP